MKLKYDEYASQNILYSVIYTCGKVNEHPVELFSHWKQGVTGQIGSKVD